MIEPSLKNVAYLKLTLWNSSTKQEFSNYLTKTMGREETRPLYLKVKDHLKELDKMAEIGTEENA